MRGRSLILPRSSLYEGDKERLAVGNALNALGLRRVQCF